MIERIQSMFRRALLAALVGIVGIAQAGSINPGQGVVNELKGSAIASAATLNLSAATGNFVHVTGTNAITAITLYPGAERTVIFDGALTLTSGANLKLPGNANITTAAGDRAIFRGDSSGVVYCISYVHADGTTVITTGVSNGGTGQTSLTANNVLLGNGTGPVQFVAPGASGNLLTSNGTTWQSTAPPTQGLTLLQTITPTAANAVNFLNAFSSSYDNYLIVVSGVKPSTGDSLVLRLATGGVLDTGSNYIGFQSDNQSNIAPVTNLLPTDGNAVGATGNNDANLEILVLNANDATRVKFVSVRGFYVSSGSYYTTEKVGGYIAASAVSGGALFWNTGTTNFGAVGKIRIYGYGN